MKSHENFSSYQKVNTLDKENIVVKGIINSKIKKVIHQFTRHYLINSPVLIKKIQSFMILLSLSPWIKSNTKKI